MHDSAPDDGAHDTEPVRIGDLLEAILPHIPEQMFDSCTFRYWDRPSGPPPGPLHGPFLKSVSPIKAGDTVTSFVDRCGEGCCSDEVTWAVVQRHEDHAFCISDTEDPASLYVFDLEIVSVDQ